MCGRGIEIKDYTHRAIDGEKGRGHRRIEEESRKEEEDPTGPHRRRYNRHWFGSTGSTTPYSPGFLSEPKAERK